MSILEAWSWLATAVGKGSPKAPDRMVAQPLFNVSISAKLETTSDSLFQVTKSWLISPWVYGGAYRQWCRDLRHSEKDTLIKVPELGHGNFFSSMKDFQERAGSRKWSSTKKASVIGSHPNPFTSHVGMTKMDVRYLIAFSMSIKEFCKGSEWMSWLCSVWHSISRHRQWHTRSHFVTPEATWKSLSYIDTVIVQLARGGPRPYPKHFSSTQDVQLSGTSYHFFGSLKAASSWSLSRLPSAEWIDPWNEATDTSSLASSPRRTTCSGPSLLTLLGGWAE